MKLLLLAILKQRLPFELTISTDYSDEPNSQEL